MRLFTLIALTVFLGGGSLVPVGSAAAQVLNNVAVANVAVANVTIQRRHLGSGQQGEAGFEPATLVLEDIYHAPQYMPGYPTAHTIWARVIDVPCHQEGAAIQCEGYNWMPEMGRAEYLFFRPVVMALPTPALSSPAGGPPPEVVPIQPENPLPRKSDRN